MSLKDQEQKLDEEFANLGVKPYVYHFTKDVEPFRAITIVDVEPKSVPSFNYSISKLVVEVRTSISQHPGWYMRNLLWNKGILGVAICDRRDNFDRRKGRVIAKGRLLKHLKETKR